MVHSLFSERDDWDDELESFETGWPGFFEVLRVYLKHFAGKPAATVHAMASDAGGEAQAWAKGDVVAEPRRRQRRRPLPKPV
jgi:hypothetical protein